MKFYTQKFGEIEIPETKIISMMKPILGFENLTKFCLVEAEEMLPFLWFQSLEDSTISFIIVNPRAFFSDYKIEVNRNELSELNINNAESVETYVIATIPEDPKDMSVNLQGPILINTENNFAKQMVMVNSNYKVSHKLLDMLEQTEAENEKHKEPELAGV